MEAISNLLQSCAKGDLTAVQHHLDQGLSVDSFNEEEITPLQMASAYGQEQVVCLLLTKGAALDVPNSFGWTPLMHASRYGHARTVALLIQNKADVAYVNKLGASALTMAVYSSQIGIVRTLLEAGASCTESTCEVTPLMVAAKNGYEVIVKLLLDRGVDVNYQAPSSGYTALMYASASGHKTTTQILYERGADANLTNACGKTAFDIARQRGKMAVSDFLTSKTDLKEQGEMKLSYNSVLEATKKGDFELVRDLLVEDPNQKDVLQPDDGATPLMFAAILGRLDMTELFVNMGANMNARDDVNGWTALMQAIFHGYKSLSKNDVSRYLIHAGADVNVQAFNGCTALDLASLVEDVDIDVIRLLAAKSLGNTESCDDNVKENVQRNNDHYSKGAKRWWDRMSNHLRHLKRGRTSKLEPLPTVSIPELTTTRAIRSLSDGNATNEKTSQTSPFNLALPTPALISDNLKPVTPPTFTLPSFNVPSQTMPHGRTHSPKSAHLITPVAPIWATRWLSCENSVVVSPNSSLDVRSAQHDKTIQPFTVHVSSYDDEDSRRLSLEKEFNDLQNYSSSSRSSSKSSSTLTPASSEIGEKSYGSDQELLGATLQPVVENDEVAAILKKLALEKYQPIFEEQEVDVEALMSLTDTDLVDLGIHKTESRRRLLSAIDKMNNLQR